MFIHDPEGGSEDAKQLNAMVGPGHVDQMVRTAIQACWMARPEERRNIDEVEREMRRLVERALADLREDADAFGLSSPRQ